MSAKASTISIAPDFGAHGIVAHFSRREALKAIQQPKDCRFFSGGALRQMIDHDIV